MQWNNILIDIGIKFHKENSKQMFTKHLYDDIICKVNDKNKNVPKIQALKR